MRSISTIYPAIMENAECLIIRVWTPLSIFKVGVSLNHGVPLRFVALLFEHFEQHSKQRITQEVPLLALHLP